jgi:hypothetical protein
VGTDAVGSVTVAAVPFGGTTPIAGASATGTPLGFSLSIPSSGVPANVYLEVTSSDAAWTRTHVYPFRPLDWPQTVELGLWRGEAFFANFFVNSGGVKQLVGTSVVRVFVQDCAGKGVAGATVAASSGGTVRYTDEVYPNPALQSTAPIGLSYILNVPPGPALVTAVLAGKILKPVKIVAVAQTVVCVAVLAE